MNDSHAYSYQVPVVEFSLLFLFKSVENYTDGDYCKSENHSKLKPKLLEVEG